MTGPSGHFSSLRSERGEASFELVTPLSQTEKRECAEPGGSVVYHFFRARKLVESRLTSVLFYGVWRWERPPAPPTEKGKQEQTTRHLSSSTVRSVRSCFCRFTTTQRQQLLATGRVYSCLHGACCLLVAQHRISSYSADSNKTLFECDTLHRRKRSKISHLNSRTPP